MEYLIHSSLLLAVCYVYYWLVLSRQTHFVLNRWVLLGCLLCALLLPLISIPTAWSFRQTRAEQIESSPRDQGDGLPLATDQRNNSAQSRERVAPITSMPKGSPSAEISPGERRSTDRGWLSSIPNWRTLLSYLYFIGVVVAGLNFLLQLGHIVWRIIKNPSHDTGNFHLVELSVDEAPSSFLRYVFLNPERYDEDTFHQIVEHEQIHVAQRHSIDLILVELVLIFQWFNPFAWLYRRAVEHNLEYLTDAAILKAGQDTEDYQMNLVKVAVPNYASGLVTSYNQSFLERRILMMGARRSSTRSSWRYVALTPLLVLLVLQFNPVTAEAAPARTGVAVSPAGGEVDSPTVEHILLQPSDTITRLRPNDQGVNPPPGGSSSPSEDYRPSKEATAPESGAVVMEVPRVITRSSPYTLSRVVTTEKEIRVEIGDLTNVGAFNSWTAVIEGPNVCFQFMSRSGNNNNSHHRCFPLAEFTPLPRGDKGTFTLKRTAGTMTFKGVFEDNEGMGTFAFAADPSFVTRLRSAGYGDYQDRELMLLFMADMNDKYLAYLTTSGLNPTDRELIELAIFYEDVEELKVRIATLETAGFGRQRVRRLIELQIHGVDEDYMADLAAAGFPDLNLDKIVEAKIHGISSDFVAEMEKLGFQNSSLDEIMQLAIHGISAKYVEELRDLGYTDLAARDVVDAKIHGVNADRIAGWRNAGYPDLSLREAKEWAIHGVDARMIEGLNDLGFTNLSVSDVVSAKIHGMTPDRLAAFRAADLPMDDFSALRDAFTHGVDADFVQGFRSLGYDGISLQEATQLRIHGVTPEFATAFRDVGLSDVSLEDLRELKIHGVSPDYIRKWDRNDLDVDDYIKMKSQGVEPQD